VWTVHVRLARNWTDPTGAAHAAGDLVDVDAVTLAELEATGVVATERESTTGWAGPTGAGAAWAGPTDNRD
jgi:hypothetical protein